MVLKLLLAAAPLWVLVSAGCVEALNPYRDDLPGSAIISTPSAVRISEAGAAAELRTRPWASTPVQTQNQGVSHWPLWWSDYLEDAGSDDGEFTWTWLDYGAIAYSPARQILNTVALPLSVVTDPPWALQCSDGIVSPQTFGFRNHDPVACAGVPIPPDIIEAYESAVEDGRAPQMPESTRW